MNGVPDGRPPSRFLERLGLHRPELRAWALYDWANSAFMTSVIATLGGRIGTKRAILLGLGAYVVITILAYQIRTAGDFIRLAIMVGMVQGGTQALSRSLFASMVPRHKSAEFFGFFGIFDKFGGLFGSAAFGLMLALTGSSRHAILSIMAFFLAGAAILWRVDVAEGRRVAREAEKEVPPAVA